MHRVTFKIATWMHQILHKRCFLRLCNEYGFTLYDNLLSRSVCDKFSITVSIVFISLLCLEVCSLHFVLVFYAVFYIFCHVHLRGEINVRNYPQPGNETHVYCVNSTIREAPGAGQNSRQHICTPSCPSLHTASLRTLWLAWVILSSRESCISKPWPVRARASAAAARTSSCQSLHIRTSKRRTRSFTQRKRAHNVYSAGLRLWGALRPKYLDGSH